MGQSTPDAPDQAQAYRDGIVTYLTFLPDLLRAEQDARNRYDPARVQSQQDLQDTFGARQYQQQLDALNALDPESRVIRGQLAERVSSDLESGYDLPEDYSRELETDFRGNQAARGNSLSTAAGGAETAYKGKAALDLYYKRLGAAGTFLGTPGPVQQAPLVQAVQPDRTSAYTNPAAGYAGQNWAMRNYNNVLNQSNQSNPWAGALTGAASGAQAGSAAGGWGSLIGAVAGGAAGYFSSRDLKKDIREVGRSPIGLPIVEFRYKSDPQGRLFRGTIAEEAQRIVPDAVSTDESGNLLVDYSKTDVSFCQL